MLVQKATLGTGGRCPQARSVLQGHGVVLFRNRPLGVCCGAVARRRVRSFRAMFAVSQPPARTLLWNTLRACELHFGAGFLSVQKATLGIGACLLGAASVFQCHGVLLFRNRPLGLRCGAVLRAWELHFGAGFLSVHARRRVPSFRAMGFCCFATAR